MDHIFISHATGDDAFVRELRLALEALNLPVWSDSRNLRGGDKLAPEIEKAIEEARYVIVVLSPKTVNSPWVRKEISKALEVEQKRKTRDMASSRCSCPASNPQPWRYGSMKSRSASASNSRQVE
jgi:hypothetical protein